MPVPTWQRGRPWNQQGSWRRPSEWSPLKNFHTKSSEERIEDGHHCFCQHVRHHSWSTLLLEDQSLLDWCSAAIRVLLKSVKCMQQPQKESSSESQEKLFFAKSRFGLGIFLRWPLVVFTCFNSIKVSLILLRLNSLILGSLGCYWEITVRSDTQGKPGLSEKTSSSVCWACSNLTKRGVQIVET